MKIVILVFPHHHSCGIKCVFQSWQNSSSKCSTIAAILLKLTGNGKGWWAADDADGDCDWDCDRSMRKGRSVLTAIGRRGDSKGGPVPQWSQKSRHYWLLSFHDLTLYRLAQSRARLTGEVLKGQAAPRKKSDSSHPQAWHSAAFSIHNLKSFIAAFYPPPSSSHHTPSHPADIHLSQRRIAPIQRSSILFSITGQEFF